ncbi:sugar phosphate isomerase/epimerase [Nocardioides sp. cx-169]|uniref:sugar phosphate isomerase/epimerase family protein n=1 Tax=Nocardioides sp. cx-169 TaxID=2899080 RepID=UPI001E4871E3|nr:sugar phosphate isomerase/epimerase family protein [Nocardioides sp. cx-169]MCD4533002.1 sugar phosphate isomerase/epimerase [Nocardioides sp. cx-169]
MSALSSVRWSFEEDLALWRELGIGWAGLMSAKLGEDVPGRLALLADAGMQASTVVAPRFDLADPSSWDASRRRLDRIVDAVADHGGWSVYLTPGRTTGATWDEVLATLNRAMRPSVEHARERGVRLAFEPSQRIDVSFVNTLRDAVVVAEHTGLQIVADICNCWMERDLAQVLADAAPHIGLVQIGDVALGEVARADDPPAVHRVPFGDGIVELDRLLGYVRETGYQGPMEIELIGARVEQEGYASVICRGLSAADALLRRLAL